MPAVIPSTWPASLSGAHNHLWRLVAIAQALVWFFWLPVLCKPHWEWLWSQPWLEHPMARQVLLNELGFVYLGVAVVLMLPIYRGNYRLFEQYRITDRSNFGGACDDFDFRSERPEVREAFWRLTWRSVGLYCFNYGVLVPVLTAGKYLILGDNMSFKTSDWPDYQTLFLHNVALTLVQEFAFYWSHRLAHTRSLYRFHKVHHEYKQNTIMASMHEHPVDYTVTLAGPALIAVGIVQPHSFTLFQWVIWLLVANIDDHCGYEFPWSPVRWFYMAAGTDMHEFHHSGPGIKAGCFASKLSLYDVLFNSKDRWQEWRAGRLLQALGAAKGTSGGGGGGGNGSSSSSSSTLD